MRSEDYPPTTRLDRCLSLLPQLLREVRGFISTQAPSPFSPLGIKPLDDLLRILQLPPASHRQRQNEAAIPHTGEDGDIPTPSAQEPGRNTLRLKHPVVEITSPSSGDGKTHLLYYITAVAILPASFNGIHLNGGSGAVVFLDTDGRFDAVRLRDVAANLAGEKTLFQSTSLVNEVQKEDQRFHSMLHECLRHVHVFRPQSSQALLDTIQNLETYLLSGKDHMSSLRPLRAILLDSASAFYWQDRREAEILQIPGVREERAQIAGTQLQSLDMAQAAQQTVKSLQHLQNVFSCPVVYTTWGLQRAFPRQPDPSRDAYPYQSQPALLSFRPHLPRPWPSFPTLRLVVRRDLIRPFAPQLSLDEAHREAPTRQSVVQQGNFSAWLDSWGKDKWPRGILEALRSEGVKSGFNFSIRNEGISIEVDGLGG